MAERDFKGIWMPREIWFANDIGWSAKLLLVEIDSLAKNGECFASNDYFAQFFSLSKDRISKLIGELKEKGYVEVSMIYKAGSKQIEKRLITTIGYRRKCLQGIGESSETSIGESTYSPIGENDEDNNTSFNNTFFNNTSNKRDIPTPEEKPKKAKPEKHKRGEYQHVLLTDEQEDKLIEEYGLEFTLKAITFLDEYIEMKGYKAKNHYLAIRKWVIDAVKEKEEKAIKKGEAPKTRYGNFDTDDSFQKALERSYGTKTAEADKALQERVQALKERIG